MEFLSAVVNCTTQLHARYRFTLILGNELFLLLPILLWLWNIEPAIKASFCTLLCVILESLSYSFISISLLTNGGRRGRDRQCLSLLSCEFGSWSGRGVQHYVIKFISDLWQIICFLRILRFLHQYNWPPWCSWNIVESGVK